MKLNQQYFSKEQIEKKEHLKLLDYLMSESYGAGDHINDIRICPIDCEAFIIEWIQVDPNNSEAKFQAIDDDQRVMTEYLLPDQSFIYFETQEEYNEYMEEWLKENPGWEKTQYGTWTNRIENEKFLEEYYAKKDLGASKEEYEEIFKIPSPKNLGEK